MKKICTVATALLTALSAVLAAGSRPIYGQTAEPENIHMTNVLANLDKTLDAKKAKPGDAFSAKTVSGTTLNDGTVVPPGSILQGHVDSATPSQHKSDSTMALTIDKLQVKGGKEIPVKATIVSIATFEREFGGGSGHPADRAFDSNAKDTARLNGASTGNDQSDNGPHPVPGLTLTSSVKDANSGTLTQAKGNLHLSNENQIQVSLAVLPASANTH